MVSGDLIPAAATIVRAGRLNDYEVFRKLLVRRFANTRHKIVAEQAMKSCLLTSATPETLAGLVPLSEIVAESCRRPELPADAYMHAWRCFCLGLFEYRRGNYAEAVPWLDTALAIHNPNDARETAIRLVMALVQVRLGNVERANTEAQRADELLQRHNTAAVTPTPPEAPTVVFHGYWFDWVINQILREELRQVSRAADAR